jgi:hypothetical protein
MTLASATPRTRIDDKCAYDVFKYYNIAEHELVFAAHRALAESQRGPELETAPWYWRSAGIRIPGRKHHRETVGPFTMYSGPLGGLPLPLVSIWIDSQIKTYMDRDALGDAVKPSQPQIGSQQGLRERAREAELAKRIAGATFHPDAQIAVVEYAGYAVGGMMVNPGKTDQTVGAILESAESRNDSIAALQANYSLPTGDPFLALREHELVDLVKYYRLPDTALKQILPAQLLERQVYRRTAHLIRALTISEAFAMTERWMLETGRNITTGVCETPNEDVKLLFHGRKVKAADGSKTVVGGVPHRILTAASGVELYPASYKNRPEGRTKIYTLYTFDFQRIAAESKIYRANAMSSKAGQAPH